MMTPPFPGRRFRLWVCCSISVRRTVTADAGDVDDCRSPRAGLSSAPACLMVLPVFWAGTSGDVSPSRCLGTGAGIAAVSIAAQPAGSGLPPQFRIKYSERAALIAGCDARFRCICFRGASLTGFCRLPPMRRPSWECPPSPARRHSTRAERASLSSAGAVLQRRVLSESFTTWFCQS